MLKTYSGLSHAYDGGLSAIPHYVLYPEMMAAVGAHYDEAPVRVLVLGESPYLASVEESNTPALWYQGRALRHDTSSRNINARGIFNNVILGKNPSKSKAIFHALANALADCGMAMPGACSALQSIAYMNYFQRPAERPGKSILACARDGEEADRVVTAVVGILKPDLVVFATRLGWRYALRGLVHQLNEAGIATASVPHPATSWWNRTSVPMNNMTGRAYFIQAIAVARSSLDPNKGTAARTEGISC
ncbi:hypothetical protein [Massilia sp. X63]|jgi:hypothetical protein|uniref:hypothetical protein n=1 Tax=Massilia sp. X63 TaxID=3237285 RepID=UPI0034DD0F4E